MKKLITSLVFAIVSLNCVTAQITLTANINAGTGNSWVNALTPFKGKLYMVADNGTSGKELFRYTFDGTAELAFDLAPGSADGADAFNTNKLIVTGDFLYFIGYTDAAGYELMRYDGTNPPTLAGTQAWPGSSSSNPQYPAVLDGKIYYAATANTTGTELYVYNPADNTTELVSDLFPIGDGSGSPANMFAFDGKLYFSALRVPTIGTELYEYDPSTNDVSIVSNINNVATQGSSPANFTELDGVMYFTAATQAYGRELYSYDGNEVLRRTDYNSGEADGVFSLYAYNEKIYFCGDDGENGKQLSVFDPANNTVTQVQVINPGDNTSILDWCEYKDTLYFSANNAEYGYELWKTDGANTYMVQDLAPGITSALPASLCTWQDKLYMSAYTPEYGYEVYELFTEDIVDTPVYADDVKVESLFTVYPNPAEDIIYVQATGDQLRYCTVTLLSLDGRKIANNVMHDDNNDDSIAISVHQYPAGMYVCQIADKSGQVIHQAKIIKR